MRVLVVEDERDLGELIVYNLRRAGMEAELQTNGAEALARARCNRPDLVVLDLMLPGLDGIQVSTRLRTDPRTADVPVLMLTARDSERDQVAGFDAGADDYVTKPFSMKVLMARVGALARRSRETNEGDGTLQRGPISLDTRTMEASVAGQRVDLTATELRLLACMLRKGGQVLSRHELIEQAIGPGISVTPRTIDVHMAALRRKLGVAGSMIRTVRGFGYRIAHDEADQD